MFIFSREQLQSILPPCLSSAPSPLLIDIGAGDGNVTDVIKSVLSPSVVCVTETSGVMKKVLARKGYRCVTLPQPHCIQMLEEISFCFVATEIIAIKLGGQKRR